MSGQQIHPHEWKAKQSMCSQKWASMTKEEKNRFEIKAKEEQASRNEVAQCPLQTKVAKKASASSSSAVEVHNAPAESGLCRNALKSVSRQRLMNTYIVFRLCYSASASP